MQLRMRQRAGRGDGMRGMRPAAHRLAAAAVWLVAAGPATAQLAADEASDICTPTADPCVIGVRVDVLPGALFDFGRRTVVVSGNGQLNFDSNTAELRCGRLELGGKGVDASAGDNGGSVFLTAVRGCSADSDVGCLGDRDCELGQCSGRCAVSSAGCASNADCGAETCVFGCARNRAVACAANADCALGTCSVGEGTIVTTAVMTANSASPGSFDLNAAGDIEIGAAVEAKGTDGFADGGQLTMNSFQGSVRLLAPFTATSGADGEGGYLTISAANDIVLTRTVDLNGGDFGGGSLELDAGRDVDISASVTGHSLQGSGSGGIFEVAAGGDLRISGPGSANRTVIGGDGHKADGFGGDGGVFDFFVDGEMILGPWVTVSLDGAAPDGFGGDLVLESGDDMALQDFDIEVPGTGAQGAGGTVELVAGRDFSCDPLSLISATGGTSDAGTVTIDATRHLNWSGTIDLTTSRPANGSGGDLDMAAGLEAYLYGTARTNGEFTTLEVAACRMDLGATAWFDNNADFGENILTVGETLRVRSGARVETDPSDGTNLFVYRSAAKPPVIEGTVTPAADLLVNARLIGCPVCGNGEIDDGETCDDGARVAGDGCSADCQVEGCIADTPGYPEVALCFDDNGCTADICNVQTGHCQNPMICDDGILCTVDQCVNKQCVNTPQDSRCSDGVVCNGAEICHPTLGCRAPAGPLDCDDGFDCTVDGCNEQAGGCVHALDHGLCDDGMFCNGVEICSPESGCRAGVAPDCTDSVACTTNACDEDADTCVATPVDRECRDGNPCTVDTCDPALGCLHSEPPPNCSLTTTTTSTTTTSTIPRACGDVDGDGRVVATDALITLQAAVGNTTCDPDYCDVDGDGRVVATDALVLLQFAVGNPNIELRCAGDVTTTTVTTQTTTTTTTTTTTLATATTTTTVSAAPPTTAAN